MTKARSINQPGNGPGDAGPLPGADGVAAAVSSLCLLHCLALPVALAFVPALQGLAHAGSHGPGWVHWALLAAAVPASFFALRKGTLLHGSILPWVLAAVGFSMVAAGAIVHGLGALEQLLTVVGGMVVAGAHWKNWTLSRLA